MVLTYPYGEFLNILPIRCVDSKRNDVDISGAIVADSFVYILSDDKTEVLLKIENADFSITTPNINWVPTKVQSEKIQPGNYQGEAWLKIGSAYSRFGFPVYIEKSRQNLTSQDF